MKIFITGMPGSGKSTVLMKIVERLKIEGFNVGGIITPELRVRGRRTGFKVVDLLSGREGILASVNQLTGPQVSKYRVNLNDINEVGVNAIKNALKFADLIIIDELGPMEFHSRQFLDVVKDALKSKKPLLASIHFRLRHPLLEEIRAMKDVKIFTVVREEIETLTKQVLTVFLALARYPLSS